jgi:hypothetical protein
VCVCVCLCVVEVSRSDSRKADRQPLVVIVVCKSFDANLIKQASRRNRPSLTMHLRPNKTNRLPEPSRFAIEMPNKNEKLFQRGVDKRS